MLIFRKEQTEGPGSLKIVKETELETVEQHLVHLGAGNHRDNMTRLRRFDHHCIVELTEEDFLGLVFLQSDEVLNIAPRGYDRTLRAAAKRAIMLGDARVLEFALGRVGSVAAAMPASQVASSVGEERVLT